MPEQRMHHLLQRVQHAHPPVLRLPPLLLLLMVLLLVQFQLNLRQRIGRGRQRQQLSREAPGIGQPPREALAQDAGQRGQATQSLVNRRQGGFRSRCTEGARKMNARVNQSQRLVHGRRWGR